MERQFTNPTWNARVGNICQLEDEYFVILNCKEIYQDEDGVYHDNWQAEYDAGAVVMFTHRIYSCRPATSEEIESLQQHIESKRLAATERKEAQRLKEEAWKARLLYEAREFQKFLRKEPAGIIWSGYDLPIALYSHPDSPVKKIRDGRSPEGYSVIPKQAGNGLGYDADPRWVEQAYEFAYTHSDRYTHEVVSDWLKNYGPYQWHSATDEVMALWADSYKWRGCAGHEFAVWLVYRKYPDILTIAKSENWCNESF